MASYVNAIPFFIALDFGIGNLGSSHELTHSYQLLANVNCFLVKHVVNTTKSVFLSTT